MGFPEMRSLNWECRKASVAGVPIGTQRELRDIQSPIAFSVHY